MDQADWDFLRYAISKSALGLHVEDILLMGSSKKPVR
jgi:hypothetical protein